MSTFNNTGTTLTSGVPDINDLGAYGDSERSYVMKKTIDLTSGAMTAGDIYQVLAIPADTVVLNVFFKVITPAVGTTCTIDIGVGGTGVEWNDAIDGKGAAGTLSYGIVGTDAGPDAIGTSQGTLYTTADTIDVSMQAITSITAGPKFELYATCVSVN